VFAPKDFFIKLTYYLLVLFKYKNSAQDSKPFLDGVWTNNYSSFLN
jgi:hypothetical protein